MVINSRLRPRPERADPVSLGANRGRSFLGWKIYGQGFVLTPDERKDLIGKNAKNKLIFPYLGGEEVNTSPTQSHHRYVINFGAMSLDEAKAWPDLLSIVRRKVKPERAKLRRAALVEKWWQYGEKQPALAKALAPLSRCLVTSRVSKYLMFTFQPTNRIFSDQLYVFPLETSTAFAVLQSRIHEPWARLLSSSLEDRLRYAASDCFDTFPFPQVDPRSPVPELERVGTSLYEARAAYMKATNQGLTQTYNRLKDPGCEEPAIVELRRLHEQLDAAVLAAYGWQDIEVPRFEADVPDFQDEIVDRLFVLNAERS